MGFMDVTCLFETASDLDSVGNVRGMEIHGTDPSEFLRHVAKQQIIEET